MVAPTISSPVCQEQLIEAGKLVAKSVEGCVEASQGATSDEQLLKQVGVAATGVTHALNDLLQHIKQYASGSQPIGPHGEATDRILDVTENIFSSMGDAGGCGGRTGQCLVVGVNLQLVISYHAQCREMYAFNENFLVGSFLLLLLHH